MPLKPLKPLKHKAVKAVLRDMAIKDRGLPVVTELAHLHVCSTSCSTAREGDYSHGSVSVAKGNTAVDDAFPALPASTGAAASAVTAACACHALCLHADVLEHDPLEWCMW